MESQTNLECVNKVELCGSIVHIFRSVNWLVVTLSVSVKTGMRDYPKVFWFDDMIEKIDKDFQVGDRVEITGSLRTSKAHPTTSIAGETIVMTTGWIDAKFYPSMEYKPDRNEVLLKGSFVRVYAPKPDLAIITLKIIIDDHTYFPQISCFGRNAIKAADIKEDDTVYIVAHIQTKKTDTENGTQYHQSVVCCDMRVGSTT